MGYLRAKVCVQLEDCPVCFSHMHFRTYQQCRWRTGFISQKQKQVRSNRLRPTGTVAQKEIPFIPAIRWLELLRKDHICEGRGKLQILIIQYELGTYCLARRWPCWGCLFLHALVRSSRRQTSLRRLTSLLKSKEKAKSMWDPYTKQQNINITASN